MRRGVLTGLLLWAGIVAGAPEHARPLLAEASVLEVLKAIEAGQLDTALSISETLARDYPHYPLAQVLRLELNAIVAGDREVLMRLRHWHGETLKQAHTEARLRWQHAHAPLKPDAWVQRLILSPGAHPWWVVVDLSASRLYLFRNSGGRLQVVRDVYVSKGQKGFGKQREGDRRTPVGIYHITGWRPGAALPPLYGAGALTLDYPNAWDRHLGRTGSGIWLHGTPPDLYVRPPASSRGCVVLSNAHVIALKKTLQVPEGTPVVLLDSVRTLLSATSEGSDRLLEARLKAQVPDPASFVLVRYPGERALFYAAWQSAQGRVRQFWHRDEEGGWRLALQVPGHLQVVQK